MIFDFSDHDTFIFAGGGADVVVTGAGRDTIILGSTNDNDPTYFVEGDTLVYAGAGDDEIQLLTSGAQPSASFVYGGTGQDTIVLEGYNWVDLGTTTTIVYDMFDTFQTLYDMNTGSIVFLKDVEFVQFFEPDGDGMLDINNDGRELALSVWHTAGSGRDSQVFQVTGIALPIFNVAEAIVMEFMYQFMNLDDFFNNANAVWFANDDELEEYIVSQNTQENNLVDIYTYALSTADNMVNQNIYYTQQTLDAISDNFYLSMANDPYVDTLAPDDYNW